MSSGFDTPTNALSVYNVISFSGKPIERDRITRFLRANWNAGFDATDLQDSLEFLANMRAIRADGDVVDVVKRGSNLRGPRLMRARPGAPLFFAEGAL